MLTNTTCTQQPTFKHSTHIMTAQTCDTHGEALGKERRNAPCRRASEASTKSAGRGGGVPCVVPVGERDSKSTRECFTVAPSSCHHTRTHRSSTYHEGA